MFEARQGGAGRSRRAWVLPGAVMALIWVAAIGTPAGEAGTAATDKDATEAAAGKWVTLVVKSPVKSMSDFNRAVSADMRVRQRDYTAA